MDIRYAVRVFAFKDNKVACIKYKNINKDYFELLSITLSISPYSIASFAER